MGLVDVLLGNFVSFVYDLYTSAQQSEHTVELPPWIPSQCLCWGSVSVASATCFRSPMTKEVAHLHFVLDSGVHLEVYVSQFKQLPFCGDRLVVESVHPVWSMHVVVCHFLIGLKWDIMGNCCPFSCSVHFFYLLLMLLLLSSVPREQINTYAVCHELPFSKTCTC